MKRDKAPSLTNHRMKREILFFGSASQVEPAPSHPAPNQLVAVKRSYVLKFPPPRPVVREPGQRKLDHGARQRIAEWRAYRAAWTNPIDAMECDAQRFHHLRRYVLNLNRKQTARLLRASVNSVLNWENGTHPVPFYAYLALVLISESLQYRFANDAWRDWEIVQRYNADRKIPRKQRGHVAELVNRKIGAWFLPAHLEHYHQKLQEVAALESRAHGLQAKVEELTRENAEIRELFRVDAVAGELHDMRERLATLTLSLDKGGKR